MPELNLNTLLLFAAFLAAGFIIHVVLAAFHKLPHEIAGLTEHYNGLLQVDDMDTIALAEDVRLHLGVPSCNLVTKMHTGLKKQLHRDWFCHSM